MQLLYASSVHQIQKRMCQKVSSRALLALNNTGKSLSEALFFASTNPQYDVKLFIELQVQYMKIASSEHAQNMLCT